MRTAESRRPHRPGVIAPALRAPRAGVWAWAWLLAAALLLAQGLGQAHRVLHAPVPAPHADTLGHHDDAFGHHGEPECRLYDQHAVGDAATALLAPPPAAAGPSPVRATVPAGVDLASAPPYAARAPPRG